MQPSTAPKKCATSRLAGFAMGPPTLTRQRAVNPELPIVRQNTSQIRQTMLQQADYFKRMGLADQDCHSKWDTPLSSLLRSGDLVLPPEAHTSFHTNTLQWFQTHRHRALVHIGQRPLRFPIELYVTPNRTVIISQCPVTPPDPVDALIRPQTPTKTP